MGEDRRVSRLYKVIEWLLRLIYPKIEVVGSEKLPDEAAIIVANHTQMHGPLAGEFYFPDKKYIWCAGEMMHLKDVPAYAYRDFWSKKPKFSRPFYKVLSYIIAPLSVLIFNNAHTIGVYRDTRILTTFKSTVKRLKEGANVIIFPEQDKPYNHIIYDFQDKFIDVARLYYKRTGKELLFVPMYIAPNLRKMYLGEPIRFSADTDIEQERRRICEYLMSEITDIACKLPEHTVVPYRNIPKRYYPSNISQEDTQNAKTGC